MICTEGFWEFLVWVLGVFLTIYILSYLYKIEGSSCFSPFPTGKSIQQFASTLEWLLSK